MMYYTKRKFLSYRESFGGPKIDDRIFITGVDNFAHLSRKIQTSLLHKGPVKGA